MIRADTVINTLNSNDSGPSDGTGSLAMINEGVGLFQPGNLPTVVEDSSYHTCKASAS